MVIDTVIKKGYKQTEIGTIPNDWEVNKLSKSIAKVIDNRGKTPPLTSHGYPMVEVNAIYGVNKHPDFKEVTKYVDEETYKYWFRDGHPQKGDILIATVGTVGASAIMEKKIGCIAQNIVGLRISSGFDCNYIYYFTQTEQYQSQVRAVLMGAVQPSLKVPHLLNILVVYPSNKTEQSAIAVVLNDVDQLIGSLEKLIAKKRAIKQGAMQELLTGKRRLPEFSGKWEMRRLGEVVEFMRGRALSKSDISDNGSFKCIHYGQLFTEYKELIREVKSRTNKTDGYFYSKENDVLVPTSDVTPRGLATASCIREKGVILGGGILIIRFNSGYDGLFFSYFVSQNKVAILKLVKGSTVFHIYANDLATLEINFPDFPEQIAIANVLNDMDIELEVLEQKLAKYKMLKQGMMQVLLTGRIRLS